MPITITGTLATDESPARSISSSFTIDPVDYSDTTQTIGTTYELLTTSDEAPTGTFWTIIENTGTVDVIYRINTDGTNYVFFPLPPGAVSIIPPSMANAGSTNIFSVIDVRGRSLSSTSTVRVQTFYVL